jgi:hypothetical protein
MLFQVKPPMFRQNIEALTPPNKAGGSAELQYTSSRYFSLSKVAMISEVGTHLPQLQSQTF